MRGGATGARRGRRGRRTSEMIRLARERIDDLFALAQSEARRHPGALPNRYVDLARRIGMRYNVRVLREYRDLYCRRCSAFWVEGRTVRTRLRASGRVQTCLSCGSVRRVRTRSREFRGREPSGDRLPASPEEAALLEEEEGVESGEGEDE